MGQKKSKFHDTSLLLTPKLHTSHSNIFSFTRSSNLHESKHDSGYYSEIAHNFKCDVSLTSSSNFPIEHLSILENQTRRTKRKDYTKALLLCNQINHILSKNLAQKMKTLRVNKEKLLKCHWSALNFSHHNCTMPTIVDKPGFNQKAEQAQSILDARPIIQETTVCHKPLQISSSTLLSCGRRMASLKRSRSIGLKNNNTKSISNDYVADSEIRSVKVTNLIVAKLLSENINLSKEPYSDHMGFCKIPKSLAKRYASELKQSIDIVARCLENERLKELEKLGRLGVPNDFRLTSSCYCGTSISAELISNKRSWIICRCDIDTSGIDSFFFRLGLPMYAEVYRNKSEGRLALQHITYALFMSRRELQLCMEIRDKTHLRVVWSCLEYIRNNFT